MFYHFLYVITWHHSNFQIANINDFQYNSIQYSNIFELFYFSKEILLPHLYIRLLRESSNLRLLLRLIDARLIK